MARATISLPTPLSPVISTLASDWATRSTSCCRATISALRPINCASVLVRIMRTALSRPASTSTSLTRKTLDYLTMLGTDDDEGHPEPVPAGKAARRDDPLHRDVGRERRASERQTQAAARASLHEPRRLPEDTGEADVQHLDRRRQRQQRKFRAVDLYSPGTATFFHRILWRQELRTVRWLLSSALHSVI